MPTRPIPPLPELEAQLVALISERLLETSPGFNAETNLYDAGLDSMTIMQLLILIEEEYGVVLPECALTRQNFNTVKHLAGFIQAQSAAKA
jgi:acyl carrier protein